MISWERCVALVSMALRAGWSRALQFHGVKIEDAEGNDAALKNYIDGFVGGMRSERAKEQGAKKKKPVLH